MNRLHSQLKDQSWSSRRKFVIKAGKTRAMDRRDQNKDDTRQKLGNGEGRLQTAKGDELNRMNGCDEAVKQRPRGAGGTPKPLRLGLFPCFGPFSHRISVRLNFASSLSSVLHGPYIRFLWLL